MQQNRNIVHTRWAPAGATGKDVWFADVLEWRMKDGSPWKANIVHIKASRDASLKLIEKAVKVKAQKGWSKSWNFKRCEEVVWVQADGTDVPTVIVARIQRPISGPESQVGLKDFANDWVVLVV
jgi:hypothetical protein